MARNGCSRSGVFIYELSALRGFRDHTPKALESAVADPWGACDARPEVHCRSCPSGRSEGFTCQPNGSARAEQRDVQGISESLPQEVREAIIRNVELTEVPRVLHGTGLQLSKAHFFAGSRVDPPHILCSLPNVTGSNVSTLIATDNKVVRLTTSHSQHFGKVVVDE
jgi:hypothetical protein